MDRAQAQKRDATLKAAQEEGAVLSKAYYELSLTQTGQVMLADLRTLFGASTTIRKDHEGRVDPHASLAAAGGAEVLIYINARVKAGSPGAHLLKEVNDGPMA